MKKNLILLALVVTSSSCRYFTNQSGNPEKYKEEILQTEKEFEKMVADSGMAVAFSYYVADSGVVNTQDTLFKGRLAVRNYYQGRKNKDVSLKWSPDFVDVSSSGDLGYTYGKFTFSFKDSTGTISRNNGIFHTVWKRQQDGSWRFVWD